MDDTMTAAFRSWIERWDRQQEFYLPCREERYDAMLTVLRQLIALKAIGPDPRVLDLGCGTGSIGQRLLAHIPTAHYVGVDVDAALLRLAGAVAADHGDRFTVHRRDLALDTWAAGFGDGEFDVVTSSTALHWLDEERIDAVFGRLFHLTRPGGVFLNADNLAFASSVWQDVSDAIQGERQSAAADRGQEDWDAWWSGMRADPALAPDVADRDRRFPPREPGADPAATNPPPPLAGYVAALDRAGFTDVEVLWQRLDDRLLAARRPA